MGSVLFQLMITFGSPPVCGFAGVQGQTVFSEMERVLDERLQLGR